MKKNLSLLIIAVLLSTTSVFAQSEELLWKKNFGGNGNDDFNSITKVSDGTVAVGWSAAGSFNNGDWSGISGKGAGDAIIVKYDNDGNVVWKKNFGGSDSDVFASVTAVSDGVVAVGFSGEGSFGNGDWVGVSAKSLCDGIIVKFDNDGNVVWKKNFGGSYSYGGFTDGGELVSVTAVPDGFVAVGIFGYDCFGFGDMSGLSPKGGSLDAVIVKFDHDGNMVWCKNFGGNGNDAFYSVTAVSDGIVVAGNSAAASFNNGDWNGISGKGGQDAILVKYDNAGNVVWKKNFGGSGSDHFSCVIMVPDGFVATGNSAAASFGNGDWNEVSGKGGQDAILVKFDNAGNVVWKKNFGGSATDNFNYVSASSDGFVAVGHSAAVSFGNGDWIGFSGYGGNDAIAVKYDNAGNVVWKMNFGGSAGDVFYSVAVVPDGFVATGNSAAASFGNGDWTGVSGKGNTDAIIVKYGVEPINENKNFGGSADDEFFAVTTVPDGVVAVGYSDAPSFGNGDWTGVSAKGEFDGIIVKYDNDRNVVWKKNFGGNGSDGFNYVTTVSDGVVVVGYSDAASFGNGDWNGVSGKGGMDASIVKYDNTGNVVWKKNFGGNSSDVFSAVTTVSDGIVAVGNSSAGSFGNGDWVGVSGKGGTDAIIVKYDNAGNVVWKKNFGGSSSDVFFAVTTVEDGVVAVGYSGATSFNTGDWIGILGKGGNDAIMVKYDNAGNVVWKKVFGGNGNDGFYSVTMVEGGIVASGHSAVGSFGNGDWSEVPGNGGQDAIIVKYDNTGNVVWKKNFGGSAAERFSSVTTMPDGVVAVGYSAAGSFGNGDWSGITGNGDEDAIIVKYDNNGNVVMKENFGGSASDWFFDVTTVPDGVVTVGYSYSGSFGNGDWIGVLGKGGTDAIIVKYEIEIVEPAVLSGNVTIDGNPVFDETLNANTSGLTSNPIIPNLGTLSYQWQRGTVNISGATNATYTLLQADIGQVISVVVSAENCSGSVTSLNTAPVQKASQTAPPVPTMESNTSSSITLNIVSGCEYNRSDGEYQDSPLFSGLSPSTSYPFTQRLKETATHFESPASGVANFSTAVPDFISVTDIIGVPTTATATLPLTLTGTVVPNNATNQTISWSVQNAGTTGANISEGNTLNTTSDGECVVLATIVNGLSEGENFTKDFTITVSKATLTGSVTITGNTFFGETLTAITDLDSEPVIPNLGTISYQWKRNEVNVGTNSENYSIVQDDIDNKITVTVTALNCDGSISSNPTETIIKAIQSAPDAPTLHSATTTDIILNTVSGGEYNINGGEWRASPIFEGLEPETSYTFTQRKGETETHFASPASLAAKFITEPLGIGENLLGSINIYPNPTTGELRIESCELIIVRIAIFDAVGKEVLSYHPTTISSNYHIDISHLQTGVYFIKILDYENNSVTKRIILIK